MAGIFTIETVPAAGRNRQFTLIHYSRAFAPLGQKFDPDFTEGRRGRRKHFLS
jgi:hypothetical protein